MISWGDVFFYVAPDGRVPSGQPFATIITKDYPGEPSAGLDRPGAFRSTSPRADVGPWPGAAPASASRALGPTRPGSTPLGSGLSDATDAALDPGTPNLLMPHSAYAELGWVAVVDPDERTGEQVMDLLQSAHAAAWTRWQRRHERRPDGRDRSTRAHAGRRDRRFVPGAGVDCSTSRSTSAGVLGSRLREHVLGLFEQTTDDDLSRAGVQARSPPAPSLAVLGVDASIGGLVS